MRWWLAVLLVGCGGASAAVADPDGPQPPDPEETAPVYTGSLKIENKPDAERCRTFERVTEDLVVEAPGLVHLDLHGVETVGDDLFISSNNALVELDLTDLTVVGGGLFIWDNAALVDTPGLRNVRAVGKALHVTNNASLARLTLGAVTAAETVRITSNPKLTDVGGLAQLESIQGDLVIEGNGALAALPFEALERVTGEVRIEDNPKLPRCAAEALVERLRAAGYEGRVTVDGNDASAVCP